MVYLDFLDILDLQATLKIQKIKKIKINHGLFIFFGFFRFSG